MEALLQTTLRDILCAALSLDDGLSKIQGLPFKNSNESDLLFDIARAIEEIILRRPGLANAKLTELAVRLSFEENRILPEMLILLDTRYTSSFRRSECELLPDIEAIPRLVDILGELSQGINSGIRLNLRPILPFLSDEIIMTLNAIYDRRHDGTIMLSLHEVHYLAWIMIEAGFYEGAELLLNRILEISKESDYQEIIYEVTFDYACVLTELRLFDQARDILNDLEASVRAKKDTLKLAEVTLQLAINETRDESVSHLVARKIGDKAAELYDLALKSNLVGKDEVGLAHLAIGSSILANGWREGVPEAIERLEIALRIYDSIENKNSAQLQHVYQTFAGLGFAHSLIGDHENMSMGVEFLKNARGILEQIGDEVPEHDVELSRIDHTLGWLCLSTDSDEFWNLGLESFRFAEKSREELWKKGLISDIELVSTRIGLALSLMRQAERSDSSDPQEHLRDILVQYVPLFPTDPRAYEEIAISTFDIVWLISRHAGSFSSRLRRLLDDIDKMLVDSDLDSMFINGVSLIVPYLEGSWSNLLERSKRMSRNNDNLADVAKLTAALSTAKMNLDALNVELGSRVRPPVDDEVARVDPMLAQYWLGETYLVQTVRAFYDNKDYSELANGLYGAAVAFSEVLKINSSFEESTEFIIATAASLALILRKFSITLENQYAAYIDRGQWTGTIPVIEESQYSYVLAEDWLGLIKITDAYLEMVEQSEIVEAQPYLNAVFSNITRALRMMDSISMVDRRVLAILGAEMNRRFYLRM